MTSIFNLSTDQINKAKRKFKEELGTELNAGEKAKKSLQFFAKETEENKKWLLEHGILQPAEPELRLLSPEECQEVDKEIENAEKLIEKAKGCLTVCHAIIQDGSNAEINNTIFKNYHDAMIQELIKGGLTEEEAEEDIKESFEDLRLEQKVQYI